MYLIVLASCWLVFCMTYGCEFATDSLPLSLYGCHQSNGTCTGINGCNLTVPCGAYQPSANHTNGVSYHYELITTSPSVTVTPFYSTSYLVLMVSFNHVNAKVLCEDMDGELQAEYIIKVLYPPTEVELDSVPDPISKRSLTVTCPIQGNPRPHINWTRFSDIDEASILALPADMEFHDDYQTTWTVDSWSSQFDGFYECCGSNILGSICYNDIITFRIFSSDECDSSIKETGVISVLEHRQLFALQETFTLRCLFVSAIMDQPPSWWLQPVPGESNYIRVREGDGSIYRIEDSFDSETCSWSSALTIVSFTPSLAGLYSCFRGTKQVSINITLEACYENSIANSSISLTNSNEARPLYSNTSLTCMIINSSPAVTPRWCRVSPDNNKNCSYNLKENSTFSEESCSWLSILTIHNITHDSEGVYRCLVPNTSLAYDTLLTVSEGSGITAGVSASIGVAIVIGLILAVVAGSFVISLVYIRWYRVTSYSRTIEPPVDGFKWDVFISYHNETEDLVIEQVKEPLESAQYKVCWHHDDFIVGKPITDNINEAVDNSRKVVVILSPSFTDSEHCMMELDRTLNRLLTTRTRCIVPILTDTECEVPLELRSKVTYWPIIEGVTDIYQQLIETIGKPMELSSGTEGVTQQIHS